MGDFIQGPHGPAVICMLAVFACMLLVPMVPTVFFLAKAPTPRWRQFAKRSLIAWPFFVLLVAAGPVGILLMLEWLLPLLGAQAALVRLVLYGVFVLFGALCGLFGGIYIRRGGLVIWRSGWRAVWKDRAEVAKCVDNTERELAERRREAASHTWVWWLFAALLVGGAAVLGWFWLLG